MFVLQCLNILDFPKESELENNLLLILRSKNTNDRIKGMTVKILKEKFGTELDEIKRRIRNGSIESNSMEKYPPNISAELSLPAPVSTSKVLNFFNGHYESFTKVEQAILRNENTKHLECRNGYENLLVRSKDTDDPNLLRNLFCIGKIDVSEFISKMEENLEIEDYEMILSTNQVDNDQVWDLLNKIPILTDKIKMIEVGRERFNHNIVPSSLPVRYYYNKLLRSFEDFSEKEEEEEEEETYNYKIKS